MVSLSRQDALRFLGEKLGIQEAERSLEEDRLRLLDDMILSFHDNIPFQTLSNLAVEPGLRRIPEWNEIREDLFSGRGGMCIALNGFFCAVLGSIGYDAYLTGGQMWDDKVISHSLILVRNVRHADDAYVVDVGLGFPTLCAVSLDFETESPTVIDNVWFRKFVRTSPSGSTTREEARFARVRKRCDPLKSNSWETEEERKGKDRWVNVYSFTLEPYALQELNELVNANVYLNATHSLNRSLYMTRWREGRCVLIRNNFLLVENSEGYFQSTFLDTEEDVVAAIRKEFPVFEFDLIRTALQHWKAIQNN